MNALAEARAGLVSQLSTKAYGFVPAKVVPPVIFMESNDPMLEVVRYGGWYNYHLNLYLVTPSATNEQEITNIEELALKTINEIDWDVDEISAPMSVTAGGNQFVGVKIAISTEINLLDKDDE